MADAPSRPPAASAVVDDFLDRAAARGERSVAIVRLVLAGLFAVQILGFEAARGTLGERSVVWVAVASYGVAIAYSIWVLRRLRPGPRLGRVLLASGVLDGLVIGTAMTAQTWDPGPGYAGLLAQPDVAIMLLAVVACGFRLSTPAVVAGAVTLLLDQALLFGLDLAVHRDRLAYGSQDLLAWGFCFSGAVLLALAVTRWTRSLVARGADAAVQAERARQRLGVYVSEEVAQQAMDSTSLHLGGRRQPVAVLFSDLRDFTAWSERARPEQLVFELNVYLDVMVRAVRAHGGVVDKFIGDSLMVVFGIPDQAPDDAARAVRAAVAMELALEEHNAQRVEAKLAPLRHGIGVHFGPAIAGHIGNEERLQYTVVGDVVNLASRLEGASKELGVPIVISADAAAAARAGAGGEDPCPLRSLGSISVRGRKGEIEVLAPEDYGPGAG